MRFLKDFKWETSINLTCGRVTIKNKFKNNNIMQNPFNETIQNVMQ